MSAAADLLGHPWVLWGLLGFEVLLLLLGLVFRGRVRLRATLLVGSVAANSILAGQYLGSIYTSTNMKLLLGVAWPLANLAWLVWVWRTRTRREMAEAPKPVIPPSEKRGKRQKAPEAPPPVPKRPQADDVKPPTADSATLDLRKVEPKPDQRKRTTLK